MKRLSFHCYLFATFQISYYLANKKLNNMVFNMNLSSKTKGELKSQFMNALLILKHTPQKIMVVTTNIKYSL